MADYYFNSEGLYLCRRCNGPYEVGHSVSCTGDKFKNEIKTGMLKGIHDRRETYNEKKKTKDERIAGDERTATDLAVGFDTLDLNNEAEFDAKQDFDAEYGLEDDEKEEEYYE